jgi:hypothetical protein
MEQNLNNQTVYAKAGTKLDYITRLNGGCPEGYEIERFMAGGKPCSRCKKKATVQMKKGSIMDSIKDEIETKKCGGKAKKKKMQSGGKYNESEHAGLLDKHKKGKITDAESKRLQELNRNSGHHEDGWKPSKKVKTPSKDQAKKAGEEIKKHLKGGIVFAQQGTKVIVKKKVLVAKTGVSFDGIGAARMLDSKNIISSETYPSGITELNSKRGTTYLIKNDKLIKTYDPKDPGNPLNIRKKGSINTKTPSKQNKGDDSTLYGYMINNGWSHRDASYKGRKDLWKKWFGDTPYSGTYEQNTKLLSKLKMAKVTSNNGVGDDRFAGLNNLVTLKSPTIPTLSIAPVRLPMIR